MNDRISPVVRCSVLDNFWPGGQGVEVAQADVSLGELSKIFGVPILMEYPSAAVLLFDPIIGVISFAVTDVGGEPRVAGSDLPKFDPTLTSFKPVEVLVGCNIEKHSYCPRLEKLVTGKFELRFIG